MLLYLLPALLLAVIVVRTLPLVLVAMRLRGLYRRPPQVRRIPPQELGEPHREVELGALVELETAGFQPLGWLSISQGADGDPDTAGIWFLHADGHTLACTSEVGPVQPGNHWVTFHSCLPRSGEWRTVPRQYPVLETPPPGCTLRVLPQADWRERFTAHRAATVDQTVAAPADLDALRAWLADQLEHAWRHHCPSYGAPRADGARRPGWLAAVSLASRALQTLRRLRHDPPALFPAAVVSPEELGRRALLTDLRAHRRQLAAQAARPTTPWTRKLAWSLATLAVFVGLMALVHELAAIAILALVLILHELGHLGAMRLLGYRNLQLLFIPFLGGAALGQPGRASAARQALVLLAGPVPGILLALLALQGLPPGFPDRNLWIFCLAALNAFNLLPILPLDGGQLVRLVCFPNRPRVQVGFSALSALALLVGSFLILDGAALTLMTVLAFLLLFSLPRGWKIALLASAARRRAPQPHRRDEAALQELAWETLHAGPLAHRSYAEKLPVVEGALQDLRTPPSGIGARLAIALAYGAACLLAAEAVLRWNDTRPPEPQAPCMTQAAESSSGW